MTGPLVLVSGEYPRLARALERLGAPVAVTGPDPRLPVPLQYHPDMQCCPLDGETLFVLKGGGLGEKLAGLGLEIAETEREPTGVYPGDVLCNGLAREGFLVGNPKTLDPAIVQAAQSLGLRLLPVRQGYAACAAAMVNSKSAITADQGVARALERGGLEVLRIRPGFLELPGYPTGFFGGCCGKLAPDQMAFAGSLESHPDGRTIRAFLVSRGVEPVELWKGALLDVGGILPLAEPGTGTRGVPEKKDRKL